MPLSHLVEKRTALPERAPRLKVPICKSSHIKLINK
jgi:hypothetical protein